MGWGKETADLSDYDLFLVHVPNLLNLLSLFSVILGCKPYSIVKKRTVPLNRASNIINNKK